MNKINITIVTNKERDHCSENVTMEKKDHKLHGIPERKWKKVEIAKESFLHGGRSSHNSLNPPRPKELNRASADALRQCWWWCSNHIHNNNYNNNNNWNNTITNVDYPHSPNTGLELFLLPENGCKSKQKSSKPKWKKYWSKRYFQKWGFEHNEGKGDH